MNRMNKKRIEKIINLIIRKMHLNYLLYIILFLTFLLLYYNLNNHVIYFHTQLFLHLFIQLLYNIKIKIL